MRFQLQSFSRDTKLIKHVIIITQLLRNSENRPALFHSEVWNNVHIEDLNPKTGRMKSISEMSNLRNLWSRDIPRLFDDDILDMNEVLNTYKEQVVCNIANPFPREDLGPVLKDCMTSAYLQTRITSALTQSLKTTSDSPKLNWIQKAALDKARLSESTSFQNVLMLKVSDSLTNVAASIISDIDRDGNAALRSETSLTVFWEQMLTMMPSWSDIHVSDHSLCKIQHNFLCSDTRDVPCRFPFSWLVKDRLDEMSTGVFRLNEEDDLLEDMSDNFVLEFNKCKLYELLSGASQDPQLRQDLNERYLSDYLNMVYAAQSDLEFQIAYRIFEVQLPEGWREKHVAECAVLIQIYHLRLGGQIQLEALRKTLTVFVQEINKDISCFENASRSEQPLFTLCEILLTEIESSIDNVMRTNNFTMPIKIIIGLYGGHPTAYARLMNGWNRVRFKDLNRKFVGKMNSLGVPKVQTDIYYVKVEHELEALTVQESLEGIITQLHDMIQLAVEDLAMDTDMMNIMWVCTVCGDLTHDQVVTACRHVFCRPCFENQNMQCSRCGDPIFEDSPPIPADLEDLVALVSNCCGEAVSFLSQIIVTFLSEQRLDPRILETLATLGKGRVRENRLLRSVANDKLEALQTLIFTMFVKNQLTYRDDYSEFISQSCHLQDQTVNVTTLAKFVTITQDVVNTRLDIPQLINMYNDLVEYEGVEYIQRTVQSVSGIRRVLTILVKEVSEVLDRPATPLSVYLQELRASLSTMPPRQVYTLKLFFLKQLFVDRGVSVISKVMKDDNLSWISPVEDAETQENDLFTLLGAGYTSLRNELAVSNGTNNADDVVEKMEAEECTTLHSIAATYYVLRNSPIPNNIKELVRGTLRQDSEKNCFTALCTGDPDPNTLSGVDLRRVDPFRGPLTLLYLTLQIRCKHPFLRLLESIRMYPEQSENKFLPGMRDNILSDFIGNLAEGSQKWKWYRCTNGHAYAINKCGRPMQRGRCACGAEIGGDNHQFVNNTNTMEVTDANNIGLEEKGYNLLPPGVRLLTDTERSIPPLLLNIIRWFIHASYLLSETADQYKDRIFKLGNQNLSTFLLENMQRDLEGMRLHLNAGPDECVLFLVKTIISLTVSAESRNYICSSKPDRNNVEASIVAAAQPLLENPTGVIRDAQLYEFDDPPVQLTSSDYHCRPELWRNSQPLNLTLFCNSFTNSVAAHEQDRYPTVKTFVDIREQVHLLGLLPKILDFFRRLLSRYSYKSSLEEARNTPIRDVIKDDPILEEGFAAWAQAWKEINVESTKFAIPEAYKNKKDIRDNEPLSLFLPEPVAREGICCLHLLDTLIALHNKLVRHTKRKNVKLSDRFLSVDYDPERTYHVLVIFSFCQTRR
ncbi:E3 ubiquitin-protein ligase rnf213-alpha-like [Bolinopsis microptera]|uniref:E3 ubiquitin-protein ligase rnf213-alpha-like n=1 Tax=Bolinopsis microptera TaxID=2820187 RepID=UPI00307A050A